MGEIDGPTAADYAWDSARTAQRKADDLLTRIEKLESRMTKIEALLQELLLKGAE